MFIHVYFNAIENEEMSSRHSAPALRDRVILPFPPFWEDTRQHRSLFVLVVEEVVALF